MDRFTTIVHGFYSLNIIAKNSILDVLDTVVLDTPLITRLRNNTLVNMNPIRYSFTKPSLKMFWFLHFSLLNPHAGLSLGGDEPPSGHKIFPDIGHL